jgi:transposase
MRLAVEKDLETVRKAALLLESENKKLAAKNVELTRELLKLKGLGSEQLTLKLDELQQQLDARNKALFGKSSEKRGKGSRGARDEKPQVGHGPKDQPALRGIDQIVALGSSRTRLVRTATNQSSSGKISSKRAKKSTSSVVSS